jgi:hypothetical protein
MADQFAGHARTLVGPATKITRLVAGATDIDPLPLWLRCETAGSATLLAAESVAAVTQNLVAGEIVYARIIRFTAGNAVLDAYA